jgi:hypothetical protein
MSTATTAHLARDAREHSIKLLDPFTGAEPNVHAMDAAWTLEERAAAHEENGTNKA